MPFQFDDKYGYSVIVNVVDDSVVRRDMPRISDVLPSYQWLRVAETCTRMVYQFMMILLYFLKICGLDFFHFVKTFSTLGASYM